MVKSEQQAVDVVTGDFFLTNAPYLALHIVNFDFDLIYFDILFVIAALQIREFPVIIRVANVQTVHLALKTCFCS